MSERFNSPGAQALVSILTVTFAIGTVLLFIAMTASLSETSTLFSSLRTAGGAAMVQPEMFAALGVLLLGAQFALAARNQSWTRAALCGSQSAFARVTAELERVTAELVSARRRMSVIETNLPGLVFERCVSESGAASYPLLGGSLLSVVGLTPEQARNDPSRVLSCIHPDDRRRWDALLQASEHACAGYADTFRIVGVRGEVFWAKCVASAQPGPEGGTIWTGLWIDVTAQQVAREAADAANQAKGDFLASISHELRTPLNAIIGFNDLLLGKSLSEEDRRYAALTRDAGAMLLWLVDQVLTFSKAEHGGLVTQQIPFSLSDLIDSSTALVTAALNKKAVPLQIAIAPDVPDQLLGDPEKVRQILVNLLSNAAKFTHAGAVKLWVTRLDHEDQKLRIRFAVIDSGCGIATDRLGRLFERFAQADTATGWHFGGTGLGLAICRRLVESMKGTIGATSRLGQGSTFWFEIGAEVDSSLTAPVREAVLALECTAKSRPARILVAEDVALNRELITAYLEDAGHTVHAVHNGAEAVEAISENRFDLVLMDVQMPVMDGLEASRAIRGKAGPVSSVPIVATTAGALEADLERCRSAGMNAHISKPLRKVDLLRIVRTWARTPSDQTGETAEMPSPYEHNFAAVGGLVDRLGREKIEGYLDQFLAELPGLIAFTEVGNHRPDLQAVVHRLVGSAGQLGFDRISRCCRAILAILHEGSGHQLDPEIKSLHEALVRAASDGDSLLKSYFTDCGSASRMAGVPAG